MAIALRGVLAGLALVVSLTALRVPVPADRDAAPGVPATIESSDRAWLLSADRPLSPHAKRAEESAATSIVASPLGFTPAASPSTGDAVRAVRFGADLVTFDVVERAPPPTPAR